MAKIICTLFIVSITFIDQWFDTLILCFVLWAPFFCAVSTFGEVICFVAEGVGAVFWVCVALVNWWFDALLGFFVLFAIIFTTITDICVIITFVTEIPGAFKWVHSTFSLFWRMRISTLGCKSISVAVIRGAVIYFCVICTLMT